MIAAAALPVTTSLSRTTLTEAERIAALREIMGLPDVTVGAFPAAIRRVTFANHDRWVKPLYEKHWPEALTGSTAKKLGYLTCNLYASAPYTVLFSSSSPPFLVRVLRAGAGALDMEPPTISKWAGRFFGLLTRGIDEDTHRRIIQIAAFIAAVDHIFDHCMEGVAAEERGRRMRGMIDGSWMPTDDTPNAGAFRFLRALYVDMGAGITGEDARVYELAVARLRDYFDCEVKAMSGVDDPSGCCWRMGGVMGTIDGLFFPVWRYAGDPQSIFSGAKNPARDWMYSVSLFVQVMDDWIDLEKDARDIRPTPVITGFWTIDTVRDTWRATVDGVVALARASGVDDEGWLTFVRETYRMMGLEVMEAMCKGSAA